MKPVSNIFFTPSQKMKNKALADNPPEGNWATGNLNPLTPRKANCSTWDASSISLAVFPVKIIQILFSFLGNSTEYCPGC